MSKKLETDLFEPVKKYFKDLGYRVNAEVKSCDVTASKDGFLIAVELKTSFNMTVLFQAIERQKAADQVYIAVPKAKRAAPGKRSTMLHICKKLNIGLLIVGERSLEVLSEPQLPPKIKNNTKKRSMLEEIEARRLDTNVGGSTKKKLMTAFREKNIFVAYCLFKYGQAKAGLMVKDYGCPEGTREILYRNYYGWYRRLGNGIYELTEKGQAELFDTGNLPLIEIIRRDECEQV